MSENSVILSGLVPAGVRTHLPPLEVSVVRKFLDPFWAGASRRTNLPPIEVFSYQKIPLSFLGRAGQPVPLGLVFFIGLFYINTKFITMH